MPKKRTRQEWEMILGDQVKRHLSNQEVVQEYGVGLSTLQLWKNKLGDVINREFVEVTITESKAEKSSIVLISPKGLRFEIPCKHLGEVLSWVAEL